MNRFSYFFLVLAILAWHESLAAQILVLLPLNIKSHHTFCQPILKELANRGHKLTILTPIDDKNAHKNVKQILVPSFRFRDSMAGFVQENDINYFRDGPTTSYTNHVMLYNATLQITDDIMKSSIYQDFLANDKTKFDLIIYESFYHDAFIVHAAKYNAPFVAISTFGQAHFINQFMGNPYETSYVSHEFHDYTGKFKFIDRFKNIFWTGVELYERGRYLMSKQFELAKKYSLVPMEKLPRIHDVERNVSLVLTNSHFSMYGVKPNLPNIVEIGGVHIDESKTIPQDLKKFMDEAKDGVIYFSFGSTVSSDSIPDHVHNLFSKIFSRLKQRVIWKWDGQPMNEKPRNVFTAKWLPQVAVLSHPNVKLFINQAGGLSMQESISKGVPVLCFPLYGDQPGNCARAKQMGYGEYLPVNKLVEEEVESVINKILSDKGYKENAMKVSAVYNDRPLSPIDTTMYWIEYVIRHKGAPHLSSPARQLYWYEYYSVDVAMLYGLLIYYIIYTLNWMFWNIALRRPINRDHLKDLRKQNMPKVPMKDD